MQRRAAAVYAAIFILAAAGAYAVIGVADEPAVEIADPDYSLSPGDTVTFDDRTYTVRSVQAATNEGNDLRSTELAWTNESARYTATLGNDSLVPVTDVRWPGQAARQTATFQNGSTVTLDGTDYVVAVATGDEPTEFDLVADDGAQTYAVGDTIAYRGETATVTAVSPWAVTLTWGEPYRVRANPTAEPPAVTFTQELNVTARLAADPAVEDAPVTRADGRQYVVFAANGSTKLLSAYLPEPETRTVAVGASIEYQGHEATLVSVSNESAIVAWTAPRTNTVSLAEGDRQTFGGTEYVAHFPDNRTAVLTSDTGSYEREVAAVETYHERINGFWGVSIVSGLAAVLLLGTAYLPSRY